MKIKKIGIIAVLFAVFLMGEVYADQSYPGTFYSAEKIEGVYFYKHLDGVLGTDSRDYHGQATIYKKSTDGNIVYCIESGVPLYGAKPGEHVNTGVNHPEFLSDDDAFKIEALAYYGYGYKDRFYDHTDPKWYAVTQYMIWTIQAPEMEHYFVDSLTSTTPIYPYLKEIDELSKLVHDHTTDVGIQDYSYNQNLIVGSPQVIRDAEDVLCNYQTVSSDTLALEFINHRELLITAYTAGTHTINLTQNYEYYGKTYTFYHSNRYQDMFEPGDLASRFNTLTFYATNRIVLPPTVKPTNPPITGMEIVGGIDEENNNLTYEETDDPSTEGSIGDSSSSNDNGEENKEYDSSGEMNIPDDTPGTDEGDDEKEKTPEVETGESEKKEEVSGEVSDSNDKKDESDKEDTPSSDKNEEDEEKNLGIDSEENKKEEEITEELPSSSAEDVVNEEPNETKQPEDTSFEEKNESTNDDEVNQDTLPEKDEESPEIDSGECEKKEETEEDISINKGDEEVDISSDEKKEYPVISESSSFEKAEELDTKEDNANEEENINLGISSSVDKVNNVLDSGVMSDNLNSEYIPVEVLVPATAQNALSFVFYLISVLGLSFLKHAK